MRTCEEMGRCQGEGAGRQRLVQIPLLAAVLAICAATTHCFSQTAHNHESTAHDVPWWILWNLRRSVLLALVLMTAVYLFGVRRLWARAGRGHGISRRQSFIFLAAMAALAIALLSPIDTLGQELNSIHVVQHMLLIKLVAPLLVLGSSGHALLWALPGTVRMKFARSYAWLRRRGLRRYVLWQPILTWTTFALVIWLLHIPALYEAALHNRILHDLQHVAFVAGAYVFWRVLLDPISTLRLNPALGVLYLFTTCLQCGAMGVFIAFAPTLLYESYAQTAPGSGITAIEDQQIAGFIMWVPACFIYALAAAFIFGLWLQEPQRSETVRG